MATRLRLHAQTRHSIMPSDAASAYDTIGAGYLEYTEGRTGDVFDFDGAHAFAGRETWARLEAELVRLRAAGRQAIRILDVGCGPGTWLLRLAARARDLGFTAIDGRGFDVSREMIELAKARSTTLQDPHIGIGFDVADIADALDDEDDGSYDLVLCLFGVLNHLTAGERRQAALALRRVTEGEIFVSVRTVGGMPSIFVAALEQARGFHQDNERDRLEIDLADGRHMGLNAHLFTAAELRDLFPGPLQTREIVGLDLFHSRFGLSGGGNPIDPGDGAVAQSLARLEHLCAHDPVLLDRAEYVLLHLHSTH